MLTLSVNAGVMLLSCVCHELLLLNCSQLVYSIEIYIQFVVVTLDCYHWFHHDGNMRVAQHNIRLTQ